MSEPVRCRIISLLSSATEILFALGLGEQVLAVSHECDYPPAAWKLPKATRPLVDSSLASDQIDQQVQTLAAGGGALYEIDRELVCSLVPDLIVTQAQCDVCAVRYQDVLDLVAAEPGLARTRVVALNPLSVEEILADVERVGIAAGAEDRARMYLKSLVERIDRVREKTSLLQASQRPRVVCLEWLDPLMAAGNWTPQLLWLAGGESGLAAAGRHSGYVDVVDVLEYDPDVLFLAPCGFDLARTIQEAQTLAASPFWGRIAACLLDCVYAIDGNAYLNRSGPRIVDSLEILAHLLHPRLFGPPAWATAGHEPWAAITVDNGRLVRRALPVSA